MQMILLPIILIAEQQCNWEWCGCVWEIPPAECDAIKY